MIVWHVCTLKKLTVPSYVIPLLEKDLKEIGDTEGLIYDGEFL